MWYQTIEDNQRTNEWKEMKVTLKDENDYNAKQFKKINKYSHNIPFEAITVYDTIIVLIKPICPEQSRLWLLDMFDDEKKWIKHETLLPFGKLSAK